MGGNYKRSETWRPVINKLKRKLASWRHKHLSFKRRVVYLVNFVLSSLPLIFLSFFILPTKVAKEITSLQLNFL